MRQDELMTCDEDMRHATALVHGTVGIEGADLEDECLF